MRTRRVPACLLLAISLGASGCASVASPRPHVASNIRTVTSVGDKTLPTVAGTPGDTVVAGQPAPERRAPRGLEGRISGRVLDEEGHPVPNAEVRLAIGGAARGRSVRARTDASGAFTLQGLRRGTPYTVVAERQVGRDLLTGTASAKAPATDLRIRLAADESSPDQAVATPDDAPGRVNRISGRERQDAGDVGDPDHEGAPPRVNEEDLPPVAEATELDEPRPARRVARTAEPAAPTGWRRGGVTPPAADPSPAPREDHGDSTPTTAEPLDEPAPEPPPETPKPAPTRAPARRPVPESGVVSQQEPPPEPAPTPLPARPIEARVPEATEAEVVSPLPDLDEETPATTTEAASAPAIDAAEPPREQPESRRAPSDSPATAEAMSPAVAPTAEDPMPPAGDLPDRKDEPPAETARKPSPRAKRVTWGELSTQPGAQFAALEPRAENPKRAREKPLPAPLISRSLAGTQATCQFDSRRQQLLDFRLPDLQGRPVRFQDLDADLVLLDFWGTWCGPCVEAIPHLVALQNRLGKTVKVVGIAYEEGKTADRVAAVEAARRKLGITYPLLLGGVNGDCPLQAALHIQAYPTMILLDREGHILWRDQGAAAGTLARLDRVIDAKAKAVVARR